MEQSQRIKLVINDIVETVSHYRENGALSTDDEISNALSAEAESRGIESYKEQLMERFIMRNPQWFHK
jgi:hypothetical protein